jgi:hypothetical protein
MNTPSDSRSVAFWIFVGPTCESTRVTTWNGPQQFAAFAPVQYIHRGLIKEQRDLVRIVPVDFEDKQDVVACSVPGLLNYSGS